MNRDMLKARAVDFCWISSSLLALQFQTTEAYSDLDLTRVDRIDSSGKGRRKIVLQTGPSS
jgi:hypothetical protein